MTSSGADAMLFSMIYWLKIAAMLLASVFMSFLVTASMPSAIVIVAAHIVIFGVLIYAIRRSRGQAN